jgi:hypothetical protein
LGLDDVDVVVEVGGGVVFIAVECASLDLGRHLQSVLCVMGGLYNCGLLSSLLNEGQLERVLDAHY